MSRSIDGAAKFEVIKVAEATAEDLSTKNTWITRIHVHNQSGANRTVVIKDRQSTAVVFDEAVVADDGVLEYEYHPDVAVKFPSGLNFDSGGSGVHINILGWVAP